MWCCFCLSQDTGKCNSTHLPLSPGGLFITPPSLISQCQSLRVLCIYDYISVGVLCLWGSVKEANKSCLQRPQIFTLGYSSQSRAAGILPLENTGSIPFFFHFSYLGSIELFVSRVTGVSEIRINVAYRSHCDGIPGNSAR